MTVGERGKEETMLTGFDPQQIQDLAGARQAIVLLLNLVEEVKQENERWRVTNQELRDEISRLKGEQGKPDIKPNKKKRESHSSEKERRKPKQWQKSSKLEKVKIDREEIAKVDKSQLPADAEFKGYEPVVVQELKVETDNIRFLKEKYYSPSLQKTWLGPLPAGYEGEFGPHVRSMVITLYYAANMSEPKIRELLSHLGIFISDGQVSNILTKKNEGWHSEKETIYREGLNSSSWQHIDDTSTRVDGQNQYCHIVGNPLYTAYFTRPHKDRLTVIEVLQNLPVSQFLLNKQTEQWLEAFDVPQWARVLIGQWPQHEWLNYEQITTWVETELSRLNDQQKARVLEAAALTAYHAQTTMPVLARLMSDDAPQFKAVTEEQALCWVHDGRHYKRLTPCVDHHQKLLDKFRQEYWAYYAQLEQYRTDPQAGVAEQLRQEFDTLFSKVTGYDELDKRIAKSKAKKEQLLLALKYPEMPLHNNPAELGARQRVRKRDVSFGPRTQDGVKAWDTFMTLAETAKKLGVSFYAYVFDRVSGSHRLPDLADLIRQRAPAFHPVRVPAPP
jgi:hypothetical protein